ncbi:8791_t:CDS:2, partial [Cetraspora pellucida]
YTNSNAILNSDTNPEHNNTSSDELSSGKNISADLDMITDHSNETSNTDHSNKNNNSNCSNKKPSTNRQQECGQLVKTQSSTSNFQAYLNTHRITKPAKVVDAIKQLTISKMFYHAARQNTCQKKSINYALKVLEELTIILASFAEITQLLGGNKELDLTNMLTIFDEKEEENIVDVNEELEIIITANEDKFKLSQPQNTDNLVEKIKESLYKALDYY